MTTAVLMCGHGSRDDEAIVEFQAMVDRLRARLADTRVGSAFLHVFQLRHSSWFLQFEQAGLPLRAQLS